METVSVIRSNKFKNEFIVIAPINALLQPIPSEYEQESLYRVIKVHEKLERNKLVQWLIGGDYQRVEIIAKEGDFAVRGDIVDIYPANCAPLRIDFLVM